MNIYVTNLSTQTDDRDLAGFFAAYGDVLSAQVVRDSFTGRSRCFGFVDLPDDAAAVAILALDGVLLGGKSVRVMEARPPEIRSGSSTRSARPVPF